MDGCNGDVGNGGGYSQEMEAFGEKTEPGNALKCYLPHCTSSPETMWGLFFAEPQILSRAHCFCFASTDA